MTATSVMPSANPTPQPIPTAQPALVGKWSLARTCASIVKALTDAGQPQLIPIAIVETLSDVPENAPLPSSWSVAEPCVTAKAPTLHAHTFWPNGQFNSYDEHENQVDDGPWMLIDDHTFWIGSPDNKFTFSVTGDKLSMDPVVPTSICTTSDCVSTLAWQFSVAYPGSEWTRVAAGPHVP